LAHETGRFIIDLYAPVTALQNESIRLDVRHLLILSLAVLPQWSGIPEPLDIVRPAPQNRTITTLDGVSKSTARITLVLSLADENK
jgi:hypothetical protein